VDNCEYFQRAQVQQERHEFTTIGTPSVGDELSVHTSKGVKGLVCRARDIIACLASGDVVQITWPENQHGIWKHLRIPGLGFTARAVCKNEGNVRDSFVLENGRVINFAGATLNRNVSIRVLSLAPRDHVHEPAPEYNEDAIRSMLDGVPLPVASESRCLARV
jgi:hypothetical protein